MSKMNGSQAIANAMTIEMKRNPDLVVFGEDMRASGGGMGQCAGLAQQFPDRVWDTPISESGFLEMAVGMALGGTPVMTEVQFADFISLGFDAVANQAPKLRYLNDGKVNLPLVIRAPQGSGFFFGAQHSQIVENWFTNVPGLKIVVPGNPKDMKGMLLSALRDPDPVLYIEDKICLFVPDEVPDDDYTVPLGKANVLKPGKDLTIVTWQKGVHLVGGLMETIMKQGIDPELIDLRSMVPYDKECIAESVKKTGRLLIVHEAPVRGGFGGEIAAFVSDECFSDLKAPVKRVGSAEFPLPFGNPDRFVLPKAEDVMAAIAEIMKY